MYLVMYDAIGLCLLYRIRQDIRFHKNFSNCLCIIQ